MHGVRGPKPEARLVVVVVRWRSVVLVVRRRRRCRHGLQPRGVRHRRSRSRRRRSRRCGVHSAVLEQGLLLLLLLLVLVLIPRRGSRSRSRSRRRALALSRRPSGLRVGVRSRRGSCGGSPRFPRRRRRRWRRGRGRRRRRRGRGRLRVRAHRALSSTLLSTRRRVSRRTAPHDARRPTPDARRPTPDTTRALRARSNVAAPAASPPPRRWPTARP